ncbi:MAG TPA: hypothetical protein VIL74_12405 [Pyrinomonadaceae bacterium]|jgi:hypothetical protein
MKTRQIFLPVSVFLLILFARDFAQAQYTTWDESKVNRLYATRKFDEEQLKARFDKFIGEIDSLNLTRKYPEIARKMLSRQPREQQTGVKMLAQSQDIDALPWLLLLLNSENDDVRIWSGYALKEIVSSLALLRRDSDFPAFILLKPLQKTDVDLKPLAWIVLRMLRGEETNHISYAITMARYLNLYEFEDEIARHQNNVNPAVTNAMKWALDELKLQKKYDSNELKKEK